MPADWRTLARAARLAGDQLRCWLPIRRPEVVYAVEAVDWSVAWDGRYISRGVRAHGIRCIASAAQRFPPGMLIHWGFLGRCVRGGPAAAARGQRMLATVFHGDFGLHKAMDQQLEAFLAMAPHLERVVVPNARMKARMQGWGLAPGQLVQIPIGVDHALFRPAQPGERQRLRRQFGVPDGRYCIGSFQKDGEGWGEGRQPKLIKGPDRWVEVVRQLARHYPVHCLLTGPARGYVKQALTSAGVPFTHVPLRDYRAVAQAYRCLDVYLVTSREEGGPKALMEGCASGVPVVSTRVGMAADVLQDPRLLADDTDALVAATAQVLEGSLHRTPEALTADLLRSWTMPFSWPEVAARHARLYRELLQG
jgi:glycosyltransferase involved in cell wall biosynthesis